MQRATELARGWSALLVEEAHRRGLDPMLTVSAAQLSDAPTSGLSGLPQVQNWLGHALAQQQR